MKLSGNCAQDKAAELCGADAYTPRRIADLDGIDLSRPLAERLELIRQKLGDPRFFISSRGMKVTVKHRGTQSIDDVLLTHFSNAR